MVPAAQLMSTAGAFMQSQAVYAAAHLGVADALAAGPLPAAKLAAAVGAKEGHLRRLLRLLVLVGIFDEPEPGESCGRQVGGVSSSTADNMQGLDAEGPAQERRLPTLLKLRCPTMRRPSPALLLLQPACSARWAHA